MEPGLIYTGKGRSLSFTQNELNPDFKYRYRLLVPRPAFNDTIFFMAEAQPKEQWFYLHKLSYLLIRLLLPLPLSIMFKMLAKERTIIFAGLAV